MAHPTGAGRCSLCNAPQRLCAQADAFEARAKAHFPDVGAEAHAVAAILTALQHPAHWPAAARQWMASTLWGPGGASATARQMVTHGRQQGQHGLQRCTEAQCEDVIAMLLASDFERVAKEHFPRP